MPKKEDKPTKNWTTPTTFNVTEEQRVMAVRTALVISPGDTGSVDVLDKDGKRLCQLNISHSPNAADGEDWFNVDVIDVDERFEKRRALSFSHGERTEMAVPKGGLIVATEFTRKAK